MAPDADATAGPPQGWHDLEAVLAEEPVAKLMAAYLDQLLRHLLLQAPTSASSSPKLAKAEPRGCRGIARDARRGRFRATHRGRRAPAFSPFRLSFGPRSRCFRCFLRGGQSPGAVCGGCEPRHRVATRPGSVRGRAY